MGPSMTSVPRRELFTDDRGTGLRVTWHPEGQFVVLSIWRDDVCIATFRLAMADAAELATFLVGHLGRWATSRGNLGELTGEALPTSAEADADRLIGQNGADGLS